MNIFSYWQPIASAILTAIVAFGIHNALSDLSESHHAKELSDQKNQLTLECEEAQQKTKDIANAYQKKNASLNARVAKLTSVQPRCIVPNKTGAATGDHGTTGNEGLPDGNGISDQFLVRFAARCESEALKLDAAQEFIRSEMN